MELLRCNGEENVDLSACSEGGRELIEGLLEKGFMASSPQPMEALEPWQRYHVFPARYTENVLWSVTGKCNFICRHCLVSAPNAHHPQLPLEDCKKIVREIASCGIRRVDLTGGEPLLRRDFEEIVKDLSDYDIDIGVVFTNASLLTGETLEIFTRYGQRPSFQLSFDGLGHHDWLRGVEGAEKQADAAFHLLRKHGFSVVAAMCIHKENRDSLRPTANYLAGLNVSSLRVNAPQSLGVWKRYEEAYALSPSEVWDIYRRYIADYFADGMPLEITLDGFFRCAKGRTDYSIPYVHSCPADADWSRVPYCESTKYNIYIGPDGRLSPCMGFSETAIAEKFPSVLEEPLGKLTLSGYFHEVSDTRIADFLERNPKCKACEHLPACTGGCMVADITDEGDFLVPDERCCYFHRYIGEQAVRDVVDAAIRSA